MIPDRGVPARHARYGRTPRAAAGVTATVLTTIVGTVAAIVLLASFVQFFAPAGAIAGGTADPAVSDTDDLATLDSDGSLPIDATAVPGLVFHDIDTVINGTTVSAHWAYAPGQATINLAVEGWVQSHLDVFARQRLDQSKWRPALTSGSPQAPPGCLPGSTELPVVDLVASVAPAAQNGSRAMLITCDVMLARGESLGIRMRATEIRVVDGAPRAVSDEVGTFYGDLAAGTVATSDQLLSASGIAAVQGLAAATVDAVGESSTTPVIDTASTGTRAAMSIAGVAFAADGAVSVSLRPGTTDATGEPAGDVQVVLPPEQTAEALSDAGRAVSATVAEARPWSLEPLAAGLNRTPCALVPCIALTFDDGPGPDTARLLDYLAERNATGSFFMLGTNVQQRPDDAWRIAAEGHTLGNHTFDHPFLMMLPRDQIVDQISRTDAALVAATGEPAAYFRPPWGAFSPREAGQYAHPLVVWDIDTGDWRNPGTNALVSTVTGKAKPGSIVLMHDTNAATVDAVPAMVDALQASGYAIVGLDQMLRDAPPQLGSVTINAGDIRLSP